MAMLHNYSDELLLLAARLYYIDGLSQAEVAKFVKVSQAKVSRLLALAKERGIVHISVAEYESRNRELEAELRLELDFKAIAVVKTVAGGTAEDIRLRVAHFGGSFLRERVPAQSVVAISGGRSLQEMVRLLPEERDRRPTVVQAMGSVDNEVGPVDAVELGRSLARRWGGFFCMLNTPAFVPDRKTRDSFLALQQIRSVWDRLNMVTVALIGLGTLKDSVFVERGVLSAADLERLAQRGAVGEICGRFYDRNGLEVVSPFRDRVISLELDRLRKVPEVIAVVAGGDRSAAIAAAVRGKLLHSLVIDEQGATALSRFIKGGEKSPVKPGVKTLVAA